MLILFFNVIILILIINNLKHEIRKKEIELQKLKEKLQKRFNECLSSTGIKYHVSNPLSKITMSNNKKSSVIIYFYI